jgi:hypothetical protein
MARFIRFVTLLGVLVAPTASLWAQTTTPDPVIHRALQTITAQDFKGKLDALAHDSTRGRETPSPELARATEWVAVQFQNAGLRPAGDAGGYFQKFQLHHERLDSLSTVTVSGDGASSTWTLGNEIVHAAGGDPAELVDLPVVLLIGIPNDSTPAFGGVPVQGSAILHVISPDQLSGRFLNPIFRQAHAGGALAHIVVSEIPAELWDQLRTGSFPGRWRVIGVSDRESDFRVASYGLQFSAAVELLAAIGEDTASLMSPTEASSRALDDVTISIAPHYARVQEAEVANVVGVLAGSDPALRNEAVVFTGHIDHVGGIPGRCRSSQVLPADSICNGADDNASGTVGVIELAEAFAALDPHPARTLVFAAVTAEERGLCGSRFYVAHPVIPIDRTVAEINLDMIARNPPDTVGFVGKDYTSLGALVDRLLASHPELNLVAPEHQGRYGGSDHYPFARRGVPALFFFSGEHEDLHTAADNPDRADAEQAARIVRLAFLTGLEVANATERPTWEENARAVIVRAPE